MEKGGAQHLNKLESSSPEDALCQVWLKLAQWLRWAKKGWVDILLQGDFPWITIILLIVITKIAVHLSDVTHYFIFSRSIGVGLTLVYFILCRYNESPEPYAKGQPCSDCPTGRPVCNQGLCDARWLPNNTEMIAATSCFGFCDAFKKLLKTAILAIIFKFSFYKLNSIYFMANRLICYCSLNKVCLYLNSFIPTITLFCDGLKWRHVITWSTSRSCRLSLHGVISSLFLINVNVCINFSSRHNLTFISLVGDSICRVVQTQLAFNATYSAFKVR